MTHFLYSPGNKEYSFSNAPRSIAISPEKVDIDSKGEKLLNSGIIEIKKIAGVLRKGMRQYNFESQV